MLAKRYGLPAVEGYAAILHGWATGNFDETVATIDLLRNIGCRLGLTYFSSLVAQIHAGNGRRNQALEVIVLCLVMCKQDGERYYEPELYRLQAEIIAINQEGNDQALQSCRQAAETARNLGMYRSEALSLSALAGSNRELPDDRERLKYLRELEPDLLESNPTFFPGDTFRNKTRGG